MTSPGARSDADESGFTLIEVIGALVVLASGVLMLLHLAGILGVQMERSALRGEIVFMAQERLDSVVALPYESLEAGADTAEITLRSRPYICVVDISEHTPSIWEVTVEVEPQVSPGPRHTAISYVAKEW